MAFLKKANILAFSEKSQNIGFFQIKSQNFDFKSKYWPFSTVLLIKLYYLYWDVGFKEGSLSTPARPVFDTSARTPGGTSLNEILAKGIATLDRLVELQLARVVGKFALTGDVSQAYNSMELDEEHWVYQRVLLKDDLNVSNKSREAIITSAIYGVKCVGGQLEVLCGMLADLSEKEYPSVAEFLRKFRYVDDFTKSLDTLEKL